MPNNLEKLRGILEANMFSLADLFSPQSVEIHADFILAEVSKEVQENGLQEIIPANFGSIVRESFKEIIQKRQKHPFSHTIFANRVLSRLRIENS